MMLHNKRVLVTGGAGFVASHIVDLLVPEGCRDVVVVDNMVRGRPENLAWAKAQGGVRLIEGDIRERDLMDRLVAASDVVFHQAALRITHCAAEPRLALEVMVDATFDLLTMCAAHGIERVVAASSASIYGMADAFPTNETHHAYNNRTLYGAAKSFNEGLLRSFNDMVGLDYVALRYFNVYGPRMDIHGKYTEVLIRWMERIASGRPPLIFGDGLQTMDFVHVRDVARANIMAAKAAITDVVFNVGSGVETSLIGLAAALAKAMGRPDLEPQFVGERAVNPVSRRLAETSAAREQLGFQTSISLDQGLSELVGWWRSERVAAGREAVAELP
ncbi:MAG: NAD-dependent epimerase/dehydratase family protein [Rhodospirillales bacterium]|nr:NAD-dependent epimerase/dehydratase family protein [Rhodospirillales bacterium]